MLIKVKDHYKWKLKPVPLCYEVAKYNYTYTYVGQHFAVAGLTDSVASEFVREGIF